MKRRLPLMLFLAIWLIPACALALAGHHYGPDRDGGVWLPAMFGVTLAMVGCLLAFPAQWVVSRIFPGWGT